VRIAGLLVNSLCLAALFPSPSDSVVSLPTYPDWESNANNHVATGLGVADLNGDGWVDLVVANGNDIYRQALVVYLNNGDGTYPYDPTWSSDDIDYNGHLDLADVDKDGNIDCAVAVYLGPAGFGSKGYVKLYSGNGDGTFSAFPVWTSGDTFYCFSAAFGDVDMDGWPDLGCAGGDDYYNNPEQRRVYRNISGQLESLPSWMSDEMEYSLDVIWADFNGDGALDLGFAGTSGPNRIYFSQGGTIQTAAGWSSSDASIYANTAAAGDVDGDGWIDFAIADNSQLGGSGRFKVYKNLGNGALGTTPIWESNQAGYGSHVSFIDIDEDGDLDLSTGQWWGPVRIYENTGGVLGTDPEYESLTNSVIENEVWEDVDNDGLQNGLSASWFGDGVRKLFHLPHRPARQLYSVTVDGSPVDLMEISLDSDDARFILPSAPEFGALVRAVYLSSADIDLAVSNWDGHVGQYLFYNFRDPNGADIVTDLAPPRLLLAPNPSDGVVRLWLQNVLDSSQGICAVYDASGRKVREWRDVDKIIRWDGRDDANRTLPGGIYWVRWDLAGEKTLQTRIVRR
jgi:hypothetical protein